MLHTDLKKDLALITGATGGIGKATCEALATLGCSIAVHYNNAADKAKTLVASLEKRGVRAKAFQADLSSYDEVWLKIRNYCFCNQISSSLSLEHKVVFGIYYTEKQQFSFEEIHLVDSLCRNLYEISYLGSFNSTEIS